MCVVKITARPHLHPYLRRSGWGSLAPRRGVLAVERMLLVGAALRNALSSRFFLKVTAPRHLHPYTRFLRRRIAAGARRRLVVGRKYRRVRDPTDWAFFKTRARSSSRSPALCAERLTQIVARSKRCAARECARRCVHSFLVLVALAQVPRRRFSGCGSPSRLPAAKKK